jgi:hypothetical protein
LQPFERNIKQSERTRFEERDGLMDTRPKPTQRHPRKIRKLEIFSGSLQVGPSYPNSNSNMISWVYLPRLKRYLQVCLVRILRTSRQ